MPQVSDSVARKRSLQKDKYDLHNLKFLGDFMSTLGLTTTTAGEKIGLSQVSIYYWLKKDDAKLSVVNKLIEACGYTLSIELVEPVVDPSDTEIIIEVQRGRLLSFLSDALSDQDKELVSKQLGIGSTTIYYWLSHDDIFVSYIYKVAEVIGKKVKITIRKKISDIYDSIDDYIDFPNC